MMNRFVVVDLETTGNAVEDGDEIIEIGIVVIEDRKIVDEYRSYVKPSQQVPTFITELTGIEEDDVADAPPFSVVAKEIYPYFVDSYFVAHAAHFDYNFLNNSFMQIGMEPLNQPQLDTVELSRIFFPSAPGHRLQDITTYLNIEHFKPHRALSDAYVTALLLLKILEKIETLPYETIKQLIPLFNRLESDCDKLLFPYVQAKRNQQTEKRFTYMYGLAIRAVEEENTDFKPISISFDTFFSEQITPPHFEKRGNQKEIASMVVSALEHEKRSVIEAGPGIGKTLGYLLASYYFSLQTGKQVFISTYTHQLQQQIFQHEKRFPSIFQRGSFAILKSPMNYIHLRRFKSYYDRYTKSVHNYDLTLSLAMILVWLTETSNGDKSSIQLPSLGEDIWPLINCDIKDDPTDEASYFFKALFKAESAAVVVINHALLGADIRREERIFPVNSHYIIDEAHHFGPMVKKQFANTMHYNTIVKVLQSMSHLKLDTHVLDTRFHADAFFRSIYEAVEFLHSKEDHISETGKMQLMIDNESLEMIFKGKIRGIK